MSALGRQCGSVAKFDGRFAYCPDRGIAFAKSCRRGSLHGHCFQRRTLSKSRDRPRRIFLRPFYRDLEGILAERGVAVDHVTLNRWVVKYSPLIAANAQTRKRPTGVSWRMDKTYIKVKGKWTYYYRAADKFGKTLDFMLSEHRGNPP